MAIIDVVKWDGEGYGAQSDDQLLAWKFPSVELSTWTQLIVNESQEAVVFRGGAMDGPFGPGRHVLKTENLPVISNLLKLPFGRSPFTAEVWFTNRAIPLDVDWGTPEPIRLQDPVYKILIPVLAHGQYAVQIEHSRKFIVKLVGTMREFNRDKLRDYLQGMILTIAKTTIAQEIVKKRIPFLQISAQLTEISEAIQSALQVRLAEFGLKIVNFFVNSIDVDEDDKSIETLRSALAKSAEMGIVGYTYQQERSLNAIEGAAGFTAAENGIQAAAGGMIVLGVGLGAGLPIGAAVGQQFSTLVTPNLNAGGPAPMLPLGGGAVDMACKKCNSVLSNPTAKFCAVCGAQFESPTTLACASCSGALTPGAKFCPQCGTATAAKCTACGKDLTPGEKFCSSCGAPRAPAVTTAT